VLNPAYKVELHTHIKESLPKRLPPESRAAISATKETTPVRKITHWAGRVVWPELTLELGRANKCCTTPRKNFDDDNWSRTTPPTDCNRGSSRKDQTRSAEGAEHITSLVEESTPERLHHTSCGELHARDSKAASSRRTRRMKRRRRPIQRSWAFARST
jgi:hypothetical protein